MATTQQFTDAVALSHQLKRLKAKRIDTAMSHAMINGVQYQLAKMLAVNPQLIDQLAIEHGINTSREKFARFLTGQEVA